MYSCISFFKLEFDYNSLNNSTNKKHQLTEIKIIKYIDHEKDLCKNMQLIFEKEDQQEKTTQHREQANQEKKKKEKKAQSEMQSSVTRKNSICYSDDSEDSCWDRYEFVESWNDYN
jgi:hypothetical protein